jgi:hypothetical protein
MKNYEEGKLKVVWIESNPEEIYSKMFEGKKAALAFAKGKDDFLLFRLIAQKKMEKFSWELLPYGRYKYYLAALEMYRKPKAGIKKLQSLSNTSLGNF